MNILILGSSGMAGHLISTFLLEAGYNVTTFSTTLQPFNQHIVGDATNLATISALFKNNNYDIVINCIGILNQAADDNKKNAVFLNSYLPHFIVSELDGTDTQYVHMSTDCVFSGSKGNYTETSEYDGQSFYDRSKALGEVIDDKNITFRTSIIGPDMNPNGVGLFNWFMQQTEVKGYSNAIWSGVTTLTLAKAMAHYIMKKNTSGLIHLVNNQSISKLELLTLLNATFKEGVTVITPTNIPVINKSLISTKIGVDFCVPSYKEMLVEMKEWIDGHRELYPHYYI